ncbi:hypothetical protein BOH78_3011 [Pichia kudriavzevii]|uniref:Uncharacterized protein n=1 Tax=Pichia kudriavzevii TaxID=4909 RepID=A0A1V2LM38_PICKU|nr:hypothetical protein BOH78_3011 [Pichia kudriavzevii]
MDASTLFVFRLNVSDETVLDEADEEEDEEEEDEGCLGRSEELLLSRVKMRLFRRKLALIVSGVCRIDIIMI